MDLDEINEQPQDNVDLGSEVSEDGKADVALDFVDRFWYSSISKKSRFMDLIGDYAGTEKFILDGNALCQRVLEDPLLNLARPNDPSFQIVHAVWLIETFLKNLTEREAVFDIVFWEDYRHLPLRTGVSSFETHSLRLARQLVINHLRTLDIVVNVFENLQDPEWKEYRKVTRPMFVMTVDGGTQGDQTAKSVSENGLQSEISLCQRVLLYYVLSEGMAVCLLDGLEFRDRKILCFVFEEQRQRSAAMSLPEGVFAYMRSAMSRLEAAEAKHGPFIRLRHNNLGDTNGKITDLAELMSDFSRRVSLSIKGPSAQLLKWALRSFVAHCFTLQRITLAQRAIILCPLSSNLQAIILEDFLPLAFSHLTAVASANQCWIDVDIRVFVCLLHLQTLRNSPSLRSILAPQIASLVERVTKNQDIPFPGLPDADCFFSSEDNESTYPRAVALPRLLPFSNEILDEELGKIQVHVEEDADNSSNDTFFFFNENARFKDDRHWHNQKKILPKRLGGADEKVDPRAHQKALRRQQRFISNLQKHAETLLGGAAHLKQQIIPAVGTRRLDPPKGTVKPKAAIPQGGKSKKATKEKALTSKEKLLLNIQEKSQAKQDDACAKWWKEHLKSLEGIADPTQRRNATEALLSNERTTSGWLFSEIRLFLIHTEFQLWISHPRKDDAAVHDEFTVRIMRITKEVRDRGISSQIILLQLEVVLRTLGFEAYVPWLAGNRADGMSLENRPLNFTFIKLTRRSGALVYPFTQISEHPIVWQLRLFGEYMDRSMDSRPDPRVSFQPDGWQREVLDCLDAEESMLVVAPTSAGKTFISFYAMEKVLRESDDGILIYVAPTKALVNQVTAEVYARFRKEMKSNTCWAIHTRDYRIHDPQKCQILITVPEMFAIMILSPALSHKWVPRLKRVILDEIHTIGQQEGGTVWEQILLLAQCPIVGLSATVGEPQLFNRWLESVQRAHGIKHRFIHHPHRYSHLRKFVYLPRRHLQSLREPRQPESAEQAASDGLRFIHPISMLALGSSSMPADLSLEARDTLSLYISLRKLQPESFIPELQALDPEIFFANKMFLAQKDVILYEKQLKSCVTSLVQLPDSHLASSSLHKVISSLEDSDVARVPANVLNTAPTPAEFLADLPSLLKELDAKGHLPALLFSFDRNNCEVMANTILQSLEDGEETWRMSSDQWKSKVKKWEEWKLRKEAQRRTAEKSNTKRLTTEEQQDRQDASMAWESSFDPAEPSPQFSFAGWKKYTKQDLTDDIKELAWTSTPQWVLQGLRRGVGVHHAGMNRQYRSLVESLFRMGVVRVLFCTGTLALGINAPTKTSVFCGSSPFLTALSYRQCAGRAGRRGFDLLGNVVFYGLPMDQIQRLMLSKLPTLTGSFPLSSTLVLRLLSLLHGAAPTSTQKALSDDGSLSFPVRAIKSILGMPQISFGSDTGQEQLLHHLRFSIEYLRRVGLIDAQGRPRNLCAISAHLYHTEPSNFALIALMRAGVLHLLCKDPDRERAKRQVMLVLCHLFGRKQLHKAYASKKHVEAIRKRYPSLVVLPALPEAAYRVVQKHNEETLQIFSGYARLFAGQHSQSLGEDNCLPLSGNTIPPRPHQPDTEECTLLNDHLQKFRIDVTSRSLFVANSGHSDDVSTVEELARTARRGLQLNEHAIPTMTHILASGGEAYHADSPKLNAHIYDFYIHGQVASLVNANGIRRGEIWYILQDFALTLMTIKTAIIELLTKAHQGPDDDQQASFPAEFATAELPEVAGIEDWDARDSDVEVESPSVPEEHGSASHVHSQGSEDDMTVYNVIAELTDEFEEKFRTIWA